MVKKKKVYHHWKEDNLVSSEFLTKKKQPDGFFLLFCKYCLEYPKQTSKRSSVYGGDNHTSKGILKSKGIKKSWKKLNKEQKNIKISGPMDKFSNQLTPQLTSQRKAKFVACNLVSTEVGNYQIRTNSWRFWKDWRGCRKYPPKWAWFNMLLRISGKLHSLVAIMAEHIFLWKLDWRGRE